MTDKENLHSESLADVGKTALYYEYTSVDFREDHAIEKTLTALLNDPEVTGENIRLVTYYLVQKFFIKSANDKKESIELISQIPAAFKKMVDNAPGGNRDKRVLVKLFNIYLAHTVKAQEEQAVLFRNYNKILKGFMQKIISTRSSLQANSIQNKEAVIDQIYQYIDSVNISSEVASKSSKEKSRKKIDFWITRIFENHVIKGPLDVIIALEEYCLEEMDLSRKRIEYLKKYSKLNLEKISREIVQRNDLSTIDDSWPVISENIFMYIDTLTREHGDFKKLLEEIFSPIDPEFKSYFFSQFFTISVLQRQTEKDIYLLEKTFGDLMLMGKFREFFTLPIHQKIRENVDKAYCIENYFFKSMPESKSLHSGIFSYLTLKYLLEETLDAIQNDPGSKNGPFVQYKKAFSDLIRPKYPKFLDKLIFVYLRNSKDLERKIGNTKKVYSSIYEKNIELLKTVFETFGLHDEFNRTIQPCITGFEISNQIVKK